MNRMVHLPQTMGQGQPVSDYITEMANLVKPIWVKGIDIHAESLFID